MAEKNIKSRIILKHDTEENWEKAINFIPKLGEFIIYDPDELHPWARFKIGDGVSNINNLYFADGSNAINIIDAGCISDLINEMIDITVLDSGSISNFI